MPATDLLYAAHVPPGEGPHSTLVLLHGWGANAQDLLGLAPTIHGGNALVLCPQGSTVVPFGGGMHGYGWFPLVPGQPPDVESFLRAAGSLRSFLAMAAERYPIDRERTAVAGFSQGGMMAYELGLREPERFAGLAALSAWLPEELARELPRRPEHEGFPVLVVHGRQDTMIPVERARESREHLRPLGVSLTYREFDMGHEIQPEALRVILRWMDDRPFVHRAAPSQADRR
jgi:phospholipase/carboxylesterase